MYGAAVNARQLEIFMLRITATYNNRRVSSLDVNDETRKVAIVHVVEFHKEVVL